MRLANLLFVSPLLSFVFGIITPTLADESIELFNGKDLSGWIKRGGAATYSVDNGEIVGHSAPNTFNTFLATEKEYGDFVLELDFKISDREFNSGVQVRSHSRQEKDNEGKDLERVYGYQVEIDPKADRAWSGGIYYEGGSPERKGGWLADLANNEAARKAFKFGEWNHYKIECKGKNIKTWINDVPAVDYTDNDEKAFSPKGFIALQVHSVGSAEDKKEVRWKNLKLTLLDSK